jgi:hypothetical protein
VLALAMTGTTGHSAEPIQTVGKDGFTAYLMAYFGPQEKLWLFRF